MEELISVIVPVYNVEEYLEECLDSIINQTYRNLEIILVDDGSTDSSGAICDSYASKDSRIIVIHKENGGLSDARNAGISAANGRYILFLDSDGLWVPNQLSVRDLELRLRKKLKLARVAFQVFGPNSSAVLFAETLRPQAAPQEAGATAFLG